MFAFLQKKLVNNPFCCVLQFLFCGFALVVLLAWMLWYSFDIVLIVSSVLRISLLNFLNADANMYASLLKAAKMDGNAFRLCLWLSQS